MTILSLMEYGAYAAIIGLCLGVANLVLLVTLLMRVPQRPPQFYVPDYYRRKTEAPADSWGGRWPGPHEGP